MRILTLALTLTLANRIALADTDPERGISPGAALALSLGSTVSLMGIGAGLVIAGDRPGEDDSSAFTRSGAALLATGLVLGPAAGDLAARQWGRAALFIAARGALVISSVLLLRGGVRFSLDQGVYEDRDHLIGAGALLGGAALLAIWEIAATPSVAREQRARFRFTALPTGAGACAMAVF